MLSFEEVNFNYDSSELKTKSILRRLLAVSVLCVPRLRRIRVALLRELQGTEGDPHSLHCPLTPAQERVLHVIPEVLRDKVVNKRVNAAVETRQAQGGDVKSVQVVGSILEQEGVVHQQHNVTGGKAHYEHYQDGDDQDHSLSSLPGDGWILHAVPESLEHEDVGYDAHDGWYNKSQSSHCQEVACCRLLLTGPGDVMAGLDVEVCYTDLLVVQVQRDGDEPDHHPDCNGDGHSLTVALLLLGERVDHSPVTLNTYTSDEGDGAVHVPIEESNQHFAQPLSVDPVVAIEVVRYL